MLFGIFSGMRARRSKKSLRASEQDRPDVAFRRERWNARQAAVDPARLVFIDETWVKTNMTLNPWPLRQRRAPDRQGAGRQMADAHLPGGAQARSARLAMRD